MDSRLSLTYLTSREFLTSRRMLWALLWVNLLGTIYGYEWYWQQIEETLMEKPIWLVFYVPDSPTASLFFTLSVIYLLVDRKQAYQPSIFRGLIETIGLVTSFKYGIWAVSMILAGIYQGDGSSWQDWMLSFSHLGMAAEAILFVRFFQIKRSYLVVAALWVLSNDYIDYHFAVFPWLSKSLLDHLGAIQWFTIALSLLSLFVFYVIYQYSYSRRV